MATMRERRAEFAGTVRKVGAILKGEYGIFKKLEEEHGELSSLMKQLVNNPNDVALRRRLFPEIQVLLLAHARAEEKEFYPVLERHRETAAAALQGQREHQDVERMLGQLNMIGVESPTWLQTFIRIRDAVELHISEEEGALFSRAKQFIDRDQALDMEARFVQERKRQVYSLQRIQTSGQPRERMPEQR